MTEHNSTDALVIGAGFAGIAAATQLAELGHQVDLLERHDHAGGRARVRTPRGTEPVLVKRPPTRPPKSIKRLKPQLLLMYV